MNKKNTYIVVLILLLSITKTIASTPEYYKILASECSLKEGKTPVFSKAQTVWKASSQEQKQGFAVGNVEISEIPRKDFIWNIPRQKQSIKTFIAQDEFRSVAFVLRALKNTKHILIEKSDLTNESGNVIAAENFNIQKVKFVGNRKKWQTQNCFLESTMPAEIPANSSVWFWVTLHAPQDSVPGLYKGDFTLKANQREIKIPVTIRVLNIKFKIPKGAWGLYLPGHFFREKVKGSYKNYCPEWWTAENLPKYIKFLKTRGLNSPVLFHVYPELSLINGIPQVKFPFLNAFAKAMKQAELKGPWGIDTRFISWWAHVCALKLTKLANPESPPKDLKVYGHNALNTLQTKKTYGKIDKRLYGKAIKKLLLTAKQNDWPNYLLFSEEEIGSPTHKTKGYEAFNPTLTKLAGVDKVFLIDNSIGYNKTRIDRGERDHLKIRSYNNWTQKGIADAHRSKASIWVYNMGWKRIASGFYVEKIGASGYHQWADHWYSRNNWKVTMLNNEGISTSTELEVTHEGLGDLFWFRKYDEYMIKLKKKGFHKQFLKMKEIKDNMFNNFPVQRYAFFTASARIDDNKLNIMRWKCILAIDKAKQLLGEKGLQLSLASNSRNAEKNISTQSNPIKAFKKQTGKKVIYAVESDLDIKLDGKLNERVWRMRQNRTDRFRWTRQKEEKMRAHAGSEEEFKKRPRPSGTGVSVAYNTKGIYLKVGCNHVNPKVAKRNNDSPLLWKDDCMEFFFNKGKEYPVYQLIVSSKGKRTLLKDKDVIKCNIQVASSSPINSTGGVGQEIFVPWKDLGQSGMPQESSIWRFNVCREFHSYRQLSSWVQVYSSFGLGEGLLCFNGPVSKDKIKFKNSDFYNIYLGQNQITSKLYFAKGVKAKNIILQLRNAKESIVTQVTASKKKPTFSLSFKVPASHIAQTWTLQALEDGKKSGNVKITIPASNKVLNITRCVQEIFANDTINIKLHPKIGNISLKNSHLTGYFENKKRKRYPLDPCSLSKGINLLSISTKGLDAGQYKVVLELKGFKRVSKTIISMNILKSPY